MLAVSGIILTSCNKWLDLQPEAQVSEDELFKTAEGFEESLNGIYTRCIHWRLYGEELSFGLPEVLAQNYSIMPVDGRPEKLDYTQDVLYNYANQRLIARKDSIWSGLYNAIGNCNILLSHIEEKKAILTNNRYPIIKGEALALRAFLHFDLLRLFAPSFTSNPAAKGIPYVVKSSDIPTPLSSVEESLNKAVTDLLEAKELLAPVDSIRNAAYQVGYPAGGKENTAPSLFFQNRRNRMNYYAVCAELARIYLYKNDKQNALAYANEVIVSRKFPWTAAADFINSDAKLKDRINYPEIIFGWPIPAMERNLIDRFAALQIRKVDGDILYESPGIAAEDNRFKEWLRLSPNNSTYGLQKYIRNQEAREDDETANRHPLIAPALRLSEMYYIAAECSYDSDPSKANAFVDSVRYHRGIGIPFTPAGKTEFINGLIKEARKEFYAEGQMFYMYKRLNTAILGPSGTSYAPGNNIFVLPLPNDEIEYGGR